MKIWIIKARDDLPEDDDPWGDQADKNYTLIIRAASSEDARQMAHKHAGDEILEHPEKIIDSNWGGMPCKRYTHGNPLAWLDAKYSTCEELSPDGDPELILIERLGL